MIKVKNNKMMRLKKDCLDEYTLKKRREGIIEKEKEEKREVCGEHNGKGKRRKKRRMWRT